MEAEQNSQTPRRWSEHIGYNAISNLVEFIFGKQNYYFTFRRCLKLYIFF